MVNFELNNMLNIINIAINSKLKSIDVLMNKSNFRIIQLLHEIGILKRYEYKLKNNKKFIRIFLNYRGDGSPVIKKLKNLAIPSRKDYYSLTQLKSVKEDTFENHIIIMSTKKGIILDKDCFFFNIGGKPLIGIELF